MAQKIKLTKGELKRQRDCLKQFQRYLPTLQLKKQQLQLEILHHLRARDERLSAEEKKRRAVQQWAGICVMLPDGLSRWVRPAAIEYAEKNVAGIDIPVFQRIRFEQAHYDLFSTPLWTESAIDAFKELVSFREEIRLLERGIARLRAELRITTQRVNLFEKVKIPQAKEAIRQIKIYIGDQMTNAVVRSKIAKSKIEEALVSMV